MTTRPIQYFTVLLNSPVVLAVIFVSGIGGTFQFGFAMSVMTSPSAFIKEMVNSTCLQRYGVSLDQWQVSLIWSFAVSSFCIGGLLGTLVSGHLISKYGSKQTLLFTNAVAVSGAVLMVLSQRATSFEMIMVGRLLFGINAGISIPAHSIYLSDCTPKSLRATVGVSLAIFVSCGKFTGQLLGIRELLGTRQRWPWLLAFSGFTALLQLLTLPFLPESPSFLLLFREDRPTCEKALRRLWGNRDYTREVEEMLEGKTALQRIRNHSVMELLQNQELRWQVITIIALTISLQLCGVSSVYFYSYDVFRAAGIQEHYLPYSSMGIGLCELSTCVACFMVIGKTGKKVLLFRGYMGMSAALVLLTITLYLQNQVSWMPYCSVVLIFIFIFFFSGGPAAATPAIPVEILTQPFKSAGNSLAFTIIWPVMFLMGMIFPLLMEKLQHFSFLIFLFACAAGGLYVKFNVPETNNLTALEIAAEFQRMHSKSRDESLQMEIPTYETKEMHVEVVL